MEMLKQLGAREHVMLAPYTTLRIGGPARWFYEATQQEEVVQIVQAAAVYSIPVCILGGGSNFVVSDEGFDGAVVHVCITDISWDDDTVTAGAGTNLLSFIYDVNAHGYAGFESMAGIPGTVGGAIYGNAGAYGQEIQDRLRSVTFFDGARITTASKEACQFGYRSSVFKQQANWIILHATFARIPGDPAALQEKSAEIIALREKKYPQDMLCPGSFFKNIVLADLPDAEQAKLMQHISEDKVVHGKVPAGVLLEAVGAKGMKRGGIQVADYHANLIYNTGSGTASDIQELARILKEKVYEKFYITLEEEVQYVGFI